MILLIEWFIRFCIQFKIPYDPHRILRNNINHTIKDNTKRLFKF